MMPVTLGKDSGIAHNARWYISLRWYMITAITIPSFIAELIKEGWASDAQLTLLFFLFAMTSNVTFYFLARIHASVRYYRIFAAALISFDILLITALIFTRGGLESRSVILYVLPILGTAPMFGSIAVYFAAASAVVLYSTQVMLDYLNILRPLGINDPSLHTSATNVVETITYISSILILCALVADYITRRLVEKEQQASENLAGLNKAQHIAKMGSWEWNRRANTMSYSEGFYTLLHLKKDQYLNQEYGLLDFIHPDDKPRVKRIIDSAVKNGRAYRYEARLTLPHKSLMYVQSDGVPILNKAGNVTKVYGTVHDITDLKQLDIARKDFVAIASHQLRTPASSVKQYIGMLLGGYAGTVSETQAKMLQTAYESNERQIIIVNDLLYVAQLDSGNLHMKPEVVDLVSFLHGIIEELMPQYMASEQSVKFNSHFRQLYCKVDPSLMRMVVENIVDNARKYSHPDTHIAISLAHTDNQVRIAIADNGVGMSSEDTKKLFQKFTRIDNPLSSIAGGSGLGLYLSYKLVTMHGGKIKVTSKLGKGSTFTIMLPGTSIVQKRS
jgi:two-component system CheB/CheR fusion protein